MDRLERVLDGLERVRRNGKQYICRCPAHEDKSPSLSVTEAENGTILLHCFAGCTTDSIRRALNLEWTDLFADGRRSQTKDGTKAKFDRRGMELEAIMAASRLASEHDVLETLERRRGWTAEALAALTVGWDGQRLTIPLYDKDHRLNDVLRYDPLSKRGPKMLATPGRSRGPWPSPERTDTTGMARWLFIVEGEGTAISLWSLGLPAVGLPGAISKASGDTSRPGRWQGAGWHHAWAERFRRHQTIVCIPDCDTVGRTLMTAVTYDLEKAGARTAVVDLMPGRDDGRDIGDWARPFRTSEHRRMARDMVVGLVETVKRQPAQADEMRDTMIGFSRFVSGANTMPTVAASQVDEDDDLAPLWDWGNAA